MIMPQLLLYPLLTFHQDMPQTYRGPKSFLCAGQYVAWMAMQYAGQIGHDGRIVSDNAIPIPLTSAVGSTLSALNLQRCSCPFLSC